MTSSFIRTSVDGLCQIRILRLAKYKYRSVDRWPLGIHASEVVHIQGEGETPPEGASYRQSLLNI